MKLDQEGAIAGLSEEVKDFPVTTQTGLAAIALNFALKYFDINTVQEGALYQQYKLEGRNMTDLHLDQVFEVAIQLERHLLLTPSRLALMVLEEVSADLADAIDATPASPNHEERSNGF